MGIQNLGRIFLKNEKAPDDRIFLLQWGRCHSPGIKRNQGEKSSKGEGNSSCTVHIFLISAKMTVIRLRTLSFFSGQSYVLSVWGQLIN